MKIAKFFLILAFAVYIFLLAFNTITSPLQRDEGEYFYSAELLRQDGIPYKEAFMQKPPMIIYTYALAQTVSRSAFTPRLLALLSIFLTGLILAKILREEYGKKTALSFLVLFPAIIFLPMLQPFSAQPEIFLILPLAISWRYYMESEKNGPRYRYHLAGIGFFSAIAVLYKPIILPAAAFLIFYTIIKAGVRNGMTSTIGKSFFILAGGFFSSLMVLLPIAAKGGLQQMWEETVVFNSHYASAVGFNPPFGQALWVVWPLLVLFAWYLFKIRKHRLLFTGLFAGSLLGTAGSSIAHYYIIAVPPLSVICAAGLAGLTEFLNSKRVISNSSLAVFSFSAVISLMLITVWSHRFFLSPNEALYESYEAIEFEAAPMIANIIKENSSPQDKIFIDGSEPEILYYAGRKSATRFVIKYPLVLVPYYSEEYQDETVSDLKKNPPEIIVSYMTPNVLSRQSKRTGGLGNLDKYLTPLLMNDYKFRAAVSLPENFDKPEIVNSPEHLDSPHQAQYLVVYERKNK
jgi:hypothetical protein